MEKIYHSDQLKFIRYKNNSSDPRSISGNSIYSIFEDQTGYMWVGTDWCWYKIGLKLEEDSLSISMQKKEIIIISSVT